MAHVPVPRYSAYGEDAFYARTHAPSPPARAARRTAQPRRTNKRLYEEGPGLEGPESPAQFARSSANTAHPPSAAHGPTRGHVPPEYSRNMSRFGRYGNRGPAAPESFGPGANDPSASARTAKDTDAARRHSNWPGARDMLSIQSATPQAHKRRRTRPYEAMQVTPTPASVPHLANRAQGVEFDDDYDEDMATFRVKPYTADSNNLSPSFHTLQIQDDGTLVQPLDETQHPDSESVHHDQSEQRSRSDRRRERRAHGSSNAAAADHVTLRHRLVTILIEDRRPGREQSPSMAEVRVVINYHHGAYYASAMDVCTCLQLGPQRIDGPAKVSVYRQGRKHTFLRVPAVRDPNARVDSAHINLWLELEHGTLILKAVVEEDLSDVSYYCTRPCCASVLPPLTQARSRRSTSRRSTRSKRSRSASPRPGSREGSHTANAQALTRPASRDHGSPQLAQYGRGRSPSVHSVGGGNQQLQAASPRIQEARWSSACNSLSAQGSGSPPEYIELDDEDDVDEEPSPTSEDASAPAAEHEAPTKFQAWQTTEATSQSPLAAGKAFGSTNSASSPFGAFAKYTNQPASFGVSASPTGRARRTTDASPPQPRSEADEKIDHAVVGYLQPLLMQDPNWRVHSNGTGRDTVRKQLVLYCWVDQQIDSYAGKTTPDDMQDAPMVTITKAHVFRAVKSFFPHRHADIFDELIRLNELYGPSGSRCNDPAAMDLLDQEPEITAALAMERYLTALRVAHDRWMEKKPDDDDISW